jgi:hypothetical protein
MTAQADIVIFGTGAFAARIAFDMAATAAGPVAVVIAGRNAERLAWIETAANARAAMFRRPARFRTLEADLATDGAAAEVIGAARPAVIVQAASLQTSAVISNRGNAWTKLVAEGGLSATAVLQAPLSVRVARAVAEVRPQCRLINCCFPDVVNSLIAALGLPIACGIGNVAILANAFAGALGTTDAAPLQMLAHYQTIAPWREPAHARRGPKARVWIDGREVPDIFARFSGVRLTREPAIDISGASGVPLMLAMAGGHDWAGHVPGPHGLPGGYPVAWRAETLDLDLPASLTRDEAIAWNARFEQQNGLVLEPDGTARYTGVLREKLAATSPILAEGFHVRDLDTVHREMNALKARLQAPAA